jgi:prepilin-type processing-associated H-X9-DG protein
MRKAKDMARTARCAGVLHGLVGGLASYASESDQWIPGLNTTAMAVWAAGLQGPDALQQSHLPVQTYDWMTPILRMETHLPADRAQRFRLLLEAYACPAMTSRAILYINRAAGEYMPIDHDRFVADAARSGAFRGGSYLMPEAFQRWGQREQPIVGVEPKRRWPYTARRNPSGTSKWEVEIEAFRSRIDEVGAPAEKIAVADGTRYLPESLVLDFDHHHLPDFFGNFTCAGGWWRGSTAYGDKNASKGKNIPLSYRHRNAINAAFFDGHVQKLSQKAAHKADYWYPRGGVVVKSIEGYADYQTYKNGYVIR